MEANLRRKENGSGDGSGCVAFRGPSASTEKGREERPFTFIERPSYARCFWWNILTGTLMNPGILRGQRNEAQRSKN